jgi:hypothetical protein
MDDRASHEGGYAVGEVSTSAAYKLLRAQLQALRLRAGDPTLRELAGAWRTTPAAPTGPDGKPVTLFAVSTIGDNLNGNRASKAMSWPFVRFFVLACQRCARSQGIELSAEDRDLRLWQKRWQAHRTRPGAARGSGPPLRVVRLEEVGPDDADHTMGDNERAAEDNVRSAFAGGIKGAVS